MPATATAISLVLANPPFAGSLDYETTAKDLLAIVKTKKTELLFMALFLKLLKPGGRAAVIVPDGVLFGSSTAHKEIRRMLVEDHRLDGIVKLPSGVFRPYAGVSTAIVLFTKTNSGGTDHVWFYDCQADGFSLDDKRTPLLPAEKLGVTGTREGHSSTSCPKRAREEQSAGHRRALDRAQRRRAAARRAPRRAFACRRPRSRRPATTSRSTATRRWCTRRPSTARRRRSSPS